ncbi:MAG: hypothetical protein HW380_885 [Magnetococcales bacterium]|nr:hypothetical protein [Magnetococcales bacterium]
MPLLVCPNCNVGMLVVQRSGIELDTCPQCRGVWLDRGELEKLLQPIRNEMQNQESSGGFPKDAPPAAYRQNAPQTRHHDHSHESSQHYSHGKDKHRRRESPFEALFDIFD